MANDNRPLNLNRNRTWMITAGWLLFAVGVVGIVLPLLPTTIFWIGAVWFWSRSSPHLTERILSHPRFGRPVQLFIERGEMTRQGKLTASAGMALGYLLMQLIASPTWPVGLAVGLTLITVAVWVWLRPEPGGEASATDHDDASRLGVSPEPTIKSTTGSTPD